MKINDLIKITKKAKDIPDELIGKFGFIEEDAEYINGVKNYVVIILDNDGTPLGNGPVPESCIELTSDVDAKKAFESFNDNIKKITNNLKMKSSEINDALEKISIKYGIPVSKIRDIYTDVFKATKGILSSDD